MREKRAAFAETLQSFDFHKHQAHRWLLAKRSKREQKLRDAGLLELFDLQQEPIRLGDIARSEQRHDWGHVVFDSRIEGLDTDHPCSVYGAFEYLIRNCQLFPMFISLADLQHSAAGALQSLPVYGLPIMLDNVESTQHNRLIGQMLRLHGLNRRQELLVEQVVEVTDSEIFELYFSEEALERAAARAAQDQESSSLDDIDIWHS